MTILFIVPYYKPAYIYGGPIVVIAQLAETLVRLGHAVTVYTTTANGSTELPIPAGEELLVDGVNVLYFKRVTGDNTNVSPALWGHLNQHIREFDTVHIHTWWNLVVVGAAWVCYNHNVVPIVSPHGMFSRYVLETNNATKKKWLHKLIGQRVLKRTTLHVSTEMEWDESQQVLPGWAGKIIPNLVTLPQQGYERTQNAVFTIGFLSRIDPKKGLDKLIYALGKVGFPYELLVAGDGNQEYISELKALAESVGNTDRIKWVGWKSGEDKFAFLAQLDLFALTSHSENFAIVVIEALATGTPVLVSDKVGLYKYVSQHDYGWVTGMCTDDIVAQLHNALRESQKSRRINDLVPAIIRHEYEDSRLAAHYLDLYQAQKAIV